MRHLLSASALCAIFSIGCSLPRSAALTTRDVVKVSRHTKQNPRGDRSPAKSQINESKVVQAVADEEMKKDDVDADVQLAEETPAVADVERQRSESSVVSGISNSTPAAGLPDRESAVFSLMDLTAIAEQEHPKLRKARSEIEAAMGARVQAGLYPNPRMETNNPEIWAGRDSQVNFGWQQDFITKGKLRLDKAAADQKVRVSESNYVVEKMQVLTQVRIQFIQALAARERLRNSEEILAICKSARDVSVDLLDVGERNLTDVLLLKNQYERARVAVEMNQTNFEAELRQLAMATGVADFVVTDVSGTTISDHPPYYDEEYIREFVQSNSAHMIMARAEVLRRKIMLNRAEVEPYPDFRFGPHYAAGTAQDSNRQFWFTFVFDIPVWNLNQGNIRSAMAEVSGAQANVDRRRLELLSDLADTHARHKTSQLLLARIESSILPNAVETQRLVQQGYSRGQLDVNRVLEAQRALLDAKQDQIDAFEQAWRSAAELAGFLQFEQFP